MRTCPPRPLPPSLHPSTPKIPVHPQIHARHGRARSQQEVHQQGGLRCVVPYRRRGRRPLWDGACGPQPPLRVPRRGRRTLAGATTALPHARARGTATSREPSPSQRLLRTSRRPSWWRQRSHWSLLRDLLPRDRQDGIACQSSWTWLPVSDTTGASTMPCTCCEGTRRCRRGRWR